MSEMRWSRIVPIGQTRCATHNCCRSARWHMEAGDVGSDYCTECKDSLMDSELRSAVEAVLWFDWSDSDADAVAAIDRLRRSFEAAK